MTDVGLWEVDSLGDAMLARRRAEESVGDVRAQAMTRSMSDLIGAWFDHPEISERRIIDAGWAYVRTGSIDRAVERLVDGWGHDD